MDEENTTTRGVAKEKLPIIYTNIPEDNATLAALSALRLRCDGKDMSLHKLKLICKEAGLPQCPAACTRLELQCQLLTAIGSDLGRHYTELRSLRLDKNQIERMENLSNLQKLEALYLQENRIGCIQGLEMLSSLSVLNLSHNKICNIEGLSSLPRLHTLILGDNYLSTLESVQHLRECRSLEELDLSTNSLSDVGLVDVLEDMPHLQTLTLLGNPVSNASDPQNRDPAILPNYRRTLVGRCRALTALDHKPIFPQERRYCNVWWDQQTTNTPDPLKEAEEIAKADTLLQADALYPVFRCLDNARDLLACAQVSMWWLHLCIVNREMELAEAAAEFNEASVLWESSAGVVFELHKNDFEVLRCQGSQTPPGPLMQLLYALQMLWNIAASGHDGGCLPELPELDWATWRRQVWAAAQDMLHSPEFPSRLAEAPPLMAPATVKHLRALTGTADDLEVYVPELDVGAVERASPACGRLGHWLHAAERHMYATVRLHEATESFRAYTGTCSSPEASGTDVQNWPSPITEEGPSQQSVVVPADFQQPTAEGLEEEAPTLDAQQVYSLQAEEDLHPDVGDAPVETAVSPRMCLLQRNEEGNAAQGETLSSTADTADHSFLAAGSNLQQNEDRSRILARGGKLEAHAAEEIELRRASHPCVGTRTDGTGIGVQCGDAGPSTSACQSTPLAPAPGTLRDNRLGSASTSKACVCRSSCGGSCESLGSATAEAVEKSSEDCEDEDNGHMEAILEAFSRGGIVNSIPYM